MNAPPSAKRHHYIPQFYLRGFAVPRKKEQLLVIDRKDRKVFRSKPLNLAVERDFNRVEAEGVSPDFVETEFSKFESLTAEALKRTVEAMSFRSEQDRIAVLHLIVLFATRNPRFRNFMANSIRGLADGIMALTMASKERYNSAMANMARNTGSRNANVPYEVMKEFIESKNFDLKVNQTFLIGQELELLRGLMPFIAARSWMLLSASSDSGGFITSDHPLCLSWTQPQRVEERFNAAFGMSNTMIVCPLSRTLCAVGTYEPMGVTMVANAHHVAATNTYIAAFATRQIFAPSTDAEFLQPKTETRMPITELLNCSLFDVKQSDSPE